MSTLYDSRSARRTGTILHRLLITVLYLFLLAPILIVVVISFSSESILSFPPAGFSLRWYETLGQNIDFVNGFNTSVVVATFTSILAFIIGVPVALALVRGKFRGREFFASLFLAPLLVPAIVIGLGLLLVFSPLHLTGNYLGLVLANAGLTLPYVIRTTSLSLSTMDARCEEAARTLGANNWTVFRTVTLPIIFPGVFSGVVLAFLLTFDEAVVSLFIVTSTVQTLPVKMFTYVQSRTDPQLAALSTVLVLLSLIVVIVIERAMGLKKVLR